MNPLNIKSVVRDKYGKIAQESLLQAGSSCCGGSPGCCGDLEFSMIGDEYKGVAGYNPDADLGLGCGLPTQFAGIKNGDNVLDLGSGAGNDCFVARALVGETGMVTGLDFTDDMVGKARENASRLGFGNIQFILGDIEEMPLPDNAFDVVISNCVLNLVPDKHKAYSEIMRVLKPGGHFCISDVVIRGILPDKIRKDAEMYVGCVAGALAMDSYLNIIEKSGFGDIVIHKQKQIVIPDDILEKYLGPDQLTEYTESGSGIISITVSAKK